MANGIFTLRNQLLGLVQKAWSGTQKTPAVEYLVVAGGGSSSASLSGGGGAGGLLQGIAPITTGTALTITVGAGASAPASGIGTNGSNSVFGSITAYGGGGGGIWATGSGASGGSGGGSSSSNSAGYLMSGGQAISGQGNSGGAITGIYTTQVIGGGGGGAGSAGMSAQILQMAAGKGGEGVSTNIIGPTYAFAGGGGGMGYGTSVYGGAGGTGGGGGGCSYHSTGGAGSIGYNTGAAGGNSNAFGGNGGTNTGGGAGGVNGGGGGGGNGGSGIVIISYPDTYSAPASFGGANSPTSSTSGSGSILFNGTNYVLGPTTSALNFGTGNFTVEFWVYATSIGTLTEFFSCSNATQDFQIALSPTNYLYWHNSGVQISNVSTPASCPLNQWNHIVLVRSGTNCALFCNGVRYGTTTNSAAINLTNYYLGTYWNGAPNNYYLNGNLSNVRISNTALYSPTSSTLTTPTAPFTATSSTVLLMSTVSGAQFADSSASSLTNSTYLSPTWNQSSPFATGLGYKNRVYTWTSSGTVTF